MKNIKDILIQFNKVKDQFQNITPEINKNKTKIDLLSSRIVIFSRYYNNDTVNKQAQKIYDTLSAAVTKADMKLSKVKIGYAGVSSTMPHARYISDKISKISPKGTAGLAFNMAPVIAVTAASGMVLAAIWSLGEILDPVERNINIQSSLLDQEINGDITAAQFVTQSNAALADLSNQDYEIQQAVGFNPWIVLITSGAIYGGYKIIENTDIIKEIKRTFKDLKNHIGGK